MAQFRTFSRGGLHPRNIGLDTLEVPIRNASLPHIFRVSLAQHIGTPAEPVVAVGDTVAAGDLIGKASGYVSVNYHTPLPGKVLEVTKGTAPGGINSPMVVIEFSGYYTLGEQKPDPDGWRSQTPQQLTARMQEMGLVGMGGAGFPVHVKFSVPKDKKVDVLVINAVECEPYLSADYRLMMERSEEIFTGIEIARHVLGLKKVVIGIEADTPLAIEKMTREAAAREGVTVAPLELNYPQGAEKQLINAVLGKEVPSGGLPMDVGAVVSNVGTILAIKEAIVDGKPLTERVTTVTGTILERPGNYKIKIGTPVADVLAECGLKEEPGKIVMGGPMMGLAQFTDSIPVTKGSSGILVLSKKQARRFRHFACVRCGRCLTVCPMGLDPTRLVTLIELGKDAQAAALGMGDCIECGCCSYTCPAERHLSQGIKLGKLRAIARKKEAAGG